MTPETVKQHLYKHGLVSIIRGQFGLDGILKLADALLSGGVKVVEVTLNSTDALTAISKLNEHFADEMFVGAGTVRTASDVEDAVGAGASFLIAPCLDLPSVDAAQAHNTLLLPGIFTASEAQTAYVAGCQTVKLFPADAMGPSYLKALRAPLDHIDFVPTGGVNHETISAFHQAGAVAFGVGSALVKNVEVTTGELAALTERARVLVSALDNARATN
ncbi:MAG: bifunctional 4-hydroxy-2-oxoglutarate aldolase/2-dehydro-3-deoxy-phosphogluconate aldolase [Deinococcota bacterium]